MSIPGFRRRGTIRNQNIAMYIWSKKRPPHAGPRMVFPGVQKTTWSHDPIAKEWYFHRFYKFQPDLQYVASRRAAELLKIMGFWIQLACRAFAWMRSRL